MKKRGIFASVLLLAALFLLLPGCSREAEGRQVDSIKVLQGDGQVGLPGRPFGSELVLELLDVDGVPVPGAEVRVQAARNSDLPVPAERFRADAGGVVRIPVSAGKVLGDNYLEIIPVGAENRSRSCRFVTGLEIDGGRQQGAAGSTLDRPISVRVVDADGVPVAGQPVYFGIVNAPEGGAARLSDEVAATDSSGVARTRVTLGSGTGGYEVEVKPTGPDGRLLTRGVTVEVMGLNLPNLLISAFAGLAIFIFGMHLMSDGLQKTAGEKMKTIIRLFARNRFVGLLAGAGVTAVIQSSSATTVMVIGFF